ncbi:MAG: hypothetical protein AAF170_18100 [Bacteroidota bacterium]
MPTDFPEIEASLDETSARIAALSDEDFQRFTERFIGALPSTREGVLFTLALLTPVRRESPYPELI